MNGGIIVFFEFGAVVFWAFTAELEKKYLKIFDMFFKFQTKFIHEVDYLQFTYGQSFSVRYIINYIK